MIAAAATLEAHLVPLRQEVEEALGRVLPPAGGSPAPLVHAMRYAVLAGGKRLRPVLALAAFEVCGGEARGVPRGEVAEAAAALELFHTYSLVHDDLPCMDDDTLRRGRPTCHVVHGEAMALLAGDALQTLGFHVLASRPRGAAFAARRADAVALLGEALGVDGMAGGQALDLAATGRVPEPHEAVAALKEIHAKKTGALIRASLELGAVLAGAGAGEEARGAIATYGEALGLLFQIADDLLDVTSDSATLGKTAGKDAEQHKLTYPALFGLEGALAERDRVLDETQRAAALVEGPAGLLARLAQWAATRTH